MCVRVCVKQKNRHFSIYLIYLSVCFFVCVSPSSILTYLNSTHVVKIC